MSTAVFPSLPGLAWPVSRSPDWSGNILQEAASGKRTAVSTWSYPRWSWELTYNYLRAMPGAAEFQALAGFFNARQGRFDTFLYQDADDNAVTGQLLGVGDGLTASFQLKRALGGFVEPVFAPNVVSAVYVNGVAQASTGWIVSNWGALTPGVLSFAVAPAAGQPVTVDLSYYFPCRFDDPSISLKRFLSQIYSGDSIKFSSEK